VLIQSCSLSGLSLPLLHPSYRPYFVYYCSQIQLRMLFFSSIYYVEMRFYFMLFLSQYVNEPLIGLILLQMHCLTDFTNQQLNFWFVENNESNCWPPVQGSMPGQFNPPPFKWIWPKASSLNMISTPDFFSFVL
jgi:hypothetical protein